jgi:hypothetical protein
MSGSIVDERAEAYGDTWAKMGVTMMPIFADFIKFAMRVPKYMYPWLMIWNKCIRILFSPTKIDHWVDIQGYAELVIRDLKEKTK